MVLCGLAPDTDGLWRVEQKFKHLQRIVEDHHMYFCDPIPEMGFDDETDKCFLSPRIAKSYSSTKLLPYDS